MPQPAPSSRPNSPLDLLSLSRLLWTSSPPDSTSRSLNDTWIRSSTTTSSLQDRQPPAASPAALQAELELLRKENHLLIEENARYSEVLPQLQQELMSINAELRTNVAAKEDIERVIRELSNQKQSLRSSLLDMYDLVRTNSARRRALRSAIVILALSLALLMGVIFLGELRVTAVVARGLVILCAAFVVMAWALPPAPPRDPPP
jgi:hypothetical protein